MKPVIKVYLCDENSDRFFGEGPYRLLLKTKETGSVRAAAMSMHMAYTKAHAILSRAEENLGFPLTSRTIGGRGGGGSYLTEEAEKLIAKYERYKSACGDISQKLYKDIFLSGDNVKIGCVVMASGYSARFGSNKLLADFNGEPLIVNAFRLAASPIIDSRAVVTRYIEIAALCQNASVPCFIHSYPNKSDTIREGVRLNSDCDGIVFLQSDQPLLSIESFERLISEFKAHPEAICRLSFGDTYASPVVFPKSLFGELMSLSGETGGGKVIKRHQNLVRTVMAKNVLELQDADTPEKLQELQKASADL